MGDFSSEVFAKETKGEWYLFQFVGKNPSQTLCEFAFPALVVYPLFSVLTTNLHFFPILCHCVESGNLLFLRRRGGTL
jgi:hypothetical protein